MSMTVQTNNHWRNFSYRSEVPPAVLADEFDYQDPEESIDGFFCYRKRWYHLDEFMRGGPEGWHGFHGDSYFSGVAIRISDDGEQYQVATCYC